MKHCLVIGYHSEIFQRIKPMLEADGWELTDVERLGVRELSMLPRWDMVLITMGRVAPVGNWWDLGLDDVQMCIESNLTKPLRYLRMVWDKATHNCTVIWFSGSNPQKIMKGYAPYNVCKMAVNKLIEQLDYETPNVKFVAFGPGYVPTKIHRATLEAGWPNERIARGDEGTPIDQLYAALKWCIEQPKSVVGGRNICVSDLPLKGEMTESRFKLRRAE